MSNFDKKVIKIEDDLRVVFTPHKGQKRILFALLFQLLAFIFVQCGRKFGKTDLAIYACYWFAMMFDGCEVYYIADTQKHARELVWVNRRLPDFLKRVRHKRDGESKEDFAKRKEQAKGIYDKWIEKANDSTMKVHLTNGSMIGVDGADNYANADGIEPQFIVYDEFKHHDKRFNEAMEPNMEVYNGSIMAIGTPPENEDNYYCKVAKDCRMRDDAAFFKMPSYLNEIVYPDGEKGKKFQKIIKRYMDRGDWDILKREFYAEIVSGGSKSIFPMFEPLKVDDKGKILEYSKNMRPHKEVTMHPSKYHKDWEYVCAIDPGTTTCFAAIFIAVHKESKAVVILDEIYEKDKRKTSTRSIFPRILAKMQEFNPLVSDWMMVYDNAAAWFENEVAVEYDIGLMPCTKDVKNKEHKIGQIKDIMLADLFFCSERCKNFSFEVVNYIVDDKGKIPKENDHLLDALRYGLNAIAYDFDAIEQRALEEVVMRAYTNETDPYFSEQTDEWDDLSQEFFDE